MSRIFPEHDTRLVQSLDGVWDFVFLGDVEAQALDPAKIAFTDRMAVPGCFDATPNYAGRRGLTAYGREIRLTDAARHRLVFDSVHHVATVYLVDPRQGSARLLGDHIGGFTRFHIEFNDVPAGTYNLIVLVDNRLDYKRCPLHLDYMDWYHYGGIARGVELHRLGDLWIESLTIRTLDEKTGRISVALHWQAQREPGETPLSITCGPHILEAGKVKLTGTTGCIEREFSLVGVQPWSPLNPHLQELHVQLGQDDQRERFGLRTVRIEGKNILVNGQPVQLMGYNRHEMHPQFGHAQPLDLLIQDVQILRDMGCNFVRGSHYPQDQRFLDLCDQAGMLVWEESIGWQHNVAHLTDERFLKLQEQQLREMIGASKNHPCVILWGILNESESHQSASRPAYERLLGLIRKLDPTRPVTYACNHPHDDLCLDLCDVVSINTYPGWYFREIKDIPQELDNIVARLQAKGVGQKPLIISEIGAEGLSGFRDWPADRWSEPYQARLLETTIRHILARPAAFAGLALWLYCDFRSTEAVGRILNRARGMNNKGSLDEYRRPKMAYYTVRDLFTNR
ncbi:MAG: hypothetical protein IT443_12850 [Phycisphaeraceae bacterium]|nr:hypothetical protein [Phycisphaeraceae bacterium]